MPKTEFTNEAGEMPDISSVESRAAEMARGMGFRASNVLDHHGGGAPRFTVDYEQAAGLGRPLIQTIVELCESLFPGQALMLMIPFEPVLLYRILDGRGFESRVVEGASGFEVRFYKSMPRARTSIPGQRKKRKAKGMKRLDTPRNMKYETIMSGRVLS